jgi:putative ABC transport system ATP-binding protein
MTTALETRTAARLDEATKVYGRGESAVTALDRALVTSPDLVAADEPTGNLDSRTGQEILGFLATAVAELELTVVMVTHDPAAAAFAHRVVFVADGRVAGEMAEPTAARVLDRMKEPGR